MTENARVVDAFDYLKPAIRERGWAISQFAKRAGVSIGLAYKWLAEDPSYRINPSPAPCYKIAAALGIEPDFMLELAGHRKPGRSAPRLAVDARRQAVRDQLDRWLTAVGPEHESLFWEYLKAQGDSGVSLIRQIGTAEDQPIRPVTTELRRMPRARCLRHRPPIVATVRETTASRSELD